MWPWPGLTCCERFHCRAHFSENSPLPVTRDFNATKLVSPLTTRPHRLQERVYCKVGDFIRSLRNPYTCSLEARAYASNNEQVYGLVRPNRSEVVCGCSSDCLACSPTSANSVNLYNKPCIVLANLQWSINKDSIWNSNLSLFSYSYRHKSMFVDFLTWFICPPHSFYTTKLVLC